LQQVLALRYLGFSLEQIGRLLARPDYDVLAALEAQRDVLQERIIQLQGMAATLERLLVRLEDSGTFDARLVARATKDASEVLAQRGARMNEEQMLKRFEELGQQHKGKVRDVYDLGDGRLLMVATDRISAYDVILPNAIPDKGAVLTQMAAFWFDLTAAVAPNHFIRVADGTPADELPFDLPPGLRGRSSIVKKAQRLDVECIARGYLTGSAWAEYQQTGRVGGMRVGRGDLHSQRWQRQQYFAQSLYFRKLL
jgi:DNA-binding transcriptional MerR regulator